MSAMTRAGLVIAVGVGLVRAQEHAQEAQEAHDLARKLGGPVPPASDPFAKTDVERLWEFTLPPVTLMRGVTFDQDGDVFVTGHVSAGGDFLGVPTIGGSDVFVVGLSSSNGSVISTDVVGRTSDDEAIEIAVDGNSRIVLSNNRASGSALGGYSITKIQANGSRLTYFTHSGASDIPADMAIMQDGSIVVVGRTDGTFDNQTNAGGVDMFVTLINADLTHSWTRQVGTTNADFGTAVTTDSSGGIYVALDSYGAFDGFSRSGANDVYVMKFQSDGTTDWIRQLSSSGVDFSKDIALNGTESTLMVVGYTNGEFPGQTSSGSDDLFIAQVSSTNGEVGWILQMGTTDTDRAIKIVTNNRGDWLIGGSTFGSLHPNFTVTGLYDVFLINMDAEGVVQWIWQDPFASFQYYGILEGMDIDESNDIAVSGENQGNSWTWKVRDPATYVTVNTSATTSTSSSESSSSSTVTSTTSVSSSSKSSESSSSSTVTSSSMSSESSSSSTVTSRSSMSSRSSSSSTSTSVTTTSTSTSTSTSNTTSSPPAAIASTASKKVSTVLNIGGAALPIFFLLHVLHLQASFSQ